MSLVNGACSVENSTYLFEEGSPSCPYQLIHRIQLEHIEVNVIVDPKLGLPFNLTHPKRINVPSCLGMTVYSTNLKGVMISLEP